MNATTTPTSTLWHRSRHILTLLFCLAVACALALAFDRDTLTSSAYAWYMIIARLAFYGLALLKAKTIPITLISVIIINEGLLLAQYLGVLAW